MAQALKLNRRLMSETKFTQASHLTIEITGRSNEFSKPRQLAPENIGSGQASCLFAACYGTFHVRPGRIFCFSTAPTMISNGVSPDHQCCDPCWFNSRRYIDFSPLGAIAMNDGRDDLTSV
jgi:hypothetical protein